MNNRRVMLAAVLVSLALSQNLPAQSDAASTRPGLARLSLTSTRPDGSLDGIATFGGVQPTSQQVDALRALGLRVQPLANIPVVLMRGSRSALISSVSSGIADDVYPNDRIRYASAASDASINADKVQAM